MMMEEYKEWSNVSQMCVCVYERMQKEGKGKGKK